MATEQAVLDAMGSALWDPRPTDGSDLKAQQLAFALGYPLTWRVVRTVEPMPTATKTKAPPPTSTSLEGDATSTVKEEGSTEIGDTKGEETTKEDVASSDNKPKTAEGKQGEERKTGNANEPPSAAAMDVDTPQQQDQETKEATTIKEEDETPNAKTPVDSTTSGTSQKDESNESPSATAMKVDTPQQQEETKESTTTQEEDVTPTPPVDSSTADAKKQDNEPDETKGENDDKANEAVASATAMDVDNAQQEERRQETTTQETTTRDKPEDAAETPNVKKEDEPTKDDAKGGSTAEGTEPMQVEASETTTGPVDETLKMEETLTKEAETIKADQPSDPATFKQEINTNASVSTPMDIAQEDTKPTPPSNMPLAAGAPTAAEPNASDPKPESATNAEEPTSMVAAMSKQDTEDKPDDETREDDQQEEELETSHQNKNCQVCIVDRIYAGKPGTGCDMWFHHAAAMLAAQEWQEGNPFHFKGGHLLPRQALFDKGDKVEVLFDDDWWEAKVLRRKEHKEGFRYQVYYTVDKSKQNGIPEERLRPLKEGQTQKDPTETALQIGLGPGWQAQPTGNQRWNITAPNGRVFTSKKTALEAYANDPTLSETTSLSGGVAEATQSRADEGDPPWRTEGHPYLGRSIFWVQQHAVSARRTISVEQVGKVAGWISETDVDQAGEPGFLSEKTGQPAKLFHVTFDDEASLHPYGTYLVDTQDLEEFELEACLIPEQPPKKKKKRAPKPKDKEAKEPGS